MNRDVEGLLICIHFNEICIKTGVEKISLLLYNLYCRYKKGVSM